MKECFLKPLGLQGEWERLALQASTSLAAFCEKYILEKMGFIGMLFSIDLVNNCIYASNDFFGFKCGRKQNTVMVKTVSFSNNREL